MARIFTDQFFANLDSSTGDVNAAESLPPQCYTDRDFFEFEKKAVFHRAWRCVGREAWLKEPGEYFATSHADEPMLIVRNRDGVLKAMSSVCQHRGMLVAEGKGKAPSFRCPYHHWTYSLDGKLVGTPDMEQAKNFDKSRYSLPEFKLETWLGFIFVNLDPHAAPLAPRLAPIAEALANYQLDKVVERPGPGERVKEPWNWKVRLENANDGYHANKLHGGPQHDCCPSNLSIFPRLPDDAAGYFRFNGTTHIDYSNNPTLKPFLPIFPSLTIEDRGRCVFACVPPTLFIFARCDHVTYSIFHAEGAEEMSSQRGWIVSPVAAQDPMFKEKLHLAMTASPTIPAQDRHVDALVQVGLRSKFAPRGRYSWQETAQGDLNNWLVPRYRAEWAREKASQSH
jgi:nitrite reductase/ring-hydroxylating ferredoxin subunit